MYNPDISIDKYETTHQQYQTEDFSLEEKWKLNLVVATPQDRYRLSVHEATAVDNHQSHLVTLAWGPPKDLHVEHPYTGDDIAWTRIQAKPEADQVAARVGSARDLEKLFSPQLAPLTSSLLIIERGLEEVASMTPSECALVRHRVDNDLAGIWTPEQLAYSRLRDWEADLLDFDWDFYNPAVTPLKEESAVASSSASRAFPVSRSTTPASSSSASSSSSAVHLPHQRDTTGGIER